MTPATIVAAAEALLRDGLGLDPLALAPEHAHMQGRWRGAPAELLTRAWSGPRVRYARCSTLSGADLCIGNLLVVPASAFAGPILGVDLVAAGRDTALLAADLSPTQAPSSPARARAERALQDVRAALAELPPAGPLPAWATRCFSPSAVFVRVPLSRLSLAGEAVLAMSRWLVAELRGAAADEAGAADTDRAVREYMAAHLGDAATLGMLAKIFRPGPADRYARMVLFPP